MVISICTMLQAVIILLLSVSVLSYRDRLLSCMYSCIRYY